MDEEASGRSWHEIVLDVLKRHDVRLVTYVPDNVLRPLIDAVHADPCFTVFSTAREEEAVGIVSGAWMGGLRGIVLMQTSGFATLPNAIASLAVPFQIPVLMMVSERGTLGEFNSGQSLVAKTMRPVLAALAVEHHTMTRGIYPRSQHHPGGRNAVAVRLYPVAAADRRQGFREVRQPMLVGTSPTMTIEGRAIARNHK
jgi:sulfopyruvate decarboxylase TPP-binding subunit